MPYQIEKRGDRYCVVKIATGESMGCHGTEQGAEAQMRAIQANEQKAAPVGLWLGLRFPLHGGLQALVDDLAAQLPAADWIAPEEWHLTLLQADSADASAVMALTAAPEPIAQIGMLELEYDRLEVWEMPDRMVLVARLEESDELTSLQALTYLAAVAAGITPNDTSLPENWRAHITLAYGVDPQPLDVAAEDIYLYPDVVDLEVDDQTVARWPLEAPEEEPEMEAEAYMDTTSTVFKGADGARYMLLITSNSYKDREKQTIESKALDDYVEGSWSKERFNGDNVHLFWHGDPAIGNIVWADMTGPWLVELSRERQSGLPLIKEYVTAIWNHIEKTNVPYGASHGFGYTANDLLDDGAGGTFKAIRKFETSSLPLEYAANWLTFSGVITMNKKREEALVEIAGRGLVDTLKRALRHTEEELTDAGVQHKTLKGSITRADLQDVFVLMYKTVNDAILTKTKEAPDGEEVEVDLYAMAGEALDAFMEVPTVSLEEAAAILNPEEAVPAQVSDPNAVPALELPSDDTIKTLTALNESLVTDQAALLGELKDLAATVKSMAGMADAVATLSAAVKALQGEMAMRPRASIASETNMHGAADMVLAAIEKTVGNAAHDGFFPKEKA